MCPLHTSHYADRMTFTPIQSKSRSLNPWFKSRPDLFTPERSPKKTTTWGIIGGIALVGSILIFLNPAAVAEALGGSRRSGMAIIGAFVIPPAIVVLSAIMLLIGSRRYRLKDGDVMVNPISGMYGPVYPIQETVTALYNARADNATALSYLKPLTVPKQTNRMLQVWSSPASQHLFITILRIEGNQVFIDQEPMHLGPDRYFDAKKFWEAATLGKTSL